MKKMLGRITEKASAVTPEVLGRIEARKEVLEALAERCEACSRCSLASS